MSKVQTLLARCHEMGATFTPLPDGELNVQAPAPLPEELRKHKAEVLALLIQGQQRPSLTPAGELIVPFDSDPPLPLVGRWPEYP